MTHRIRRAVHDVWVSLGITLLVLALLEGVGRLAIAVRQPWGTAAELTAFEIRLEAGSSERSTWFKEYSREFEESYQVAWRPYVYRRRKPYTGEYIKIDEVGIRRSWNTTLSASPNQLRIFMFGGSSLWGTGARDDFTIPSFVSKKLANRIATGVWVANFGESGYVSTQEVITLMLELRKGNVPDIVLFYDGANDVWSAFQSGTAGIPQNENHRVAEFNSRRRLNLLDGFMKNLALYRVSRWSATSLFGSRFAAASDSSHLLTSKVANAVVDAYLGNVAIVDSLAREFGFQMAGALAVASYVTHIVEPLTEWQRCPGWTPVFQDAAHVVSTRAP